MLGKKSDLTLQQRIELYRNGSLFGLGLSVGLIMHSRFLGIVALLATIFCFGVYSVLKDETADKKESDELTEDDIDNLIKEENTSKKKSKV